jgi:hypothetical protein
MLNIFREDPRIVEGLKRKDFFIFGTVLLFGTTMLYAPLVYGVYLVWNAKW